MDKLADVDTEALQAALGDASESKAVKRLMVALAYADGVSVETVSARYDIPRATIYSWLDRFEQQSIAEAITDDSRPGRPAKLDPHNDGSWRPIWPDHPPNWATIRPNGRPNGHGSISNGCTISATRWVTSVDCCKNPRLVREQPVVSIPFFSTLLVCRVGSNGIIITSISSLARYVGFRMCSVPFAPSSSIVSSDPSQFPTACMIVRAFFSIRESTIDGQISVTRS